MRAVQWNVPTVLVIRDPESTIASLLLRHRKFSVAGLMREYVRYYESLHEVGNEVVIASFETATSNFGKIIESVNERYKTAFDVIDHT